nr:MAG TPA: hypothetical protein [Caudoviricetes sp.]
MLSTSLDSISCQYPTNSPRSGYPCHVSGLSCPRSPPTEGPYHTTLSSFPSPYGYVLPNGLYLVGTVPSLAH